MGNTIAVAEQVYEDQPEQVPEQQVEEEQVEKEQVEKEETVVEGISLWAENRRPQLSPWDVYVSESNLQLWKEVMKSNLFLKCRGLGLEEETQEAPEEVEEKLKITVDDIKTAPMDFRFPTTNQAKHCYTRYNEFHKCAAEKGEDAKECQKYARYYRSLCPGEWVDKWNEERENGNYAGRY